MRALLVVAALFSSGCLASPPRAAGADLVDVPTVVHDLPSGLRVALETDRSLGISGVALMIGAGSADEKPGEEGLAHLVEHLAFQSRTGDQPRLFTALRELSGSSFNGMTGPNSTIYLAFVPNDALPELLGRFAQLLEDPLRGVDQTAFEHERRITINELRLGAEDDAGEPSVQALSREIFPKDHPYAHGTAGTYESLGALTLTQAQAFVARHYRASNATLLVSGDLSGRDLTQTLGPAFAKHWQSSSERVARQKPAIAPAPVARTPQPRIPERSAPSAVPALFIGWLVPGEYGPEQAVRDVVAQLARDTLNDFYEGVARTEVDIQPLYGQSLFVVGGTLPEGPYETLRDRIVRRLEIGIRERAGNVHELFDAKRVVAADLAFPAESRFSRIVSKVEATHYARDPSHAVHLSEAVLRVSARDVQSFVARHLAPEAARAVAMKRSDADAAAELAAQGKSSDNDFGEDAVSASGRLNPKLIRTLVPSLGVTHARRARLDNGLEVLLLPRPGPRYHTALLGFREDLRPLGKAAMRAAEYALDRTYEPRPDAAGLWLWHDPGSLLRVRAPGSDVDLSLDFLRRHLTQYKVTWPTQGYYDERPEILRDEQSPQLRAWEARMTKLLGPMGRATRSSEMEALSKTALSTWLETVQSPQRALLVLVGDIDVQDALDAAEDRLGDWGDGRAHPPVPATPAPPPPQTGGDLFIADQPGHTRTLIEMDCRIYPFSLPAMMPIEVAAEIWNRELFSKFRERMTASYVASASAWGTAREAGLSAEVDIDDSKLEPALALLRGYLNGSESLRIAPETLDAARLGYARGYWSRYETSYDIAHSIVDAWQSDVPFEYLDSAADRLLSVTTRQVDEVWRSCQRTMVISAVGNKQLIKDAWAAVGVGIKDSNGD